MLRIYPVFVSYVGLSYHMFCIASVLVYIGLSLYVMYVCFIYVILGSNFPPYFFYCLHFPAF